MSERHSPFRLTRSVKERVERKLAILQAAPLGAYAWRETWQELKHLSKSRPNLHGARLTSDMAITKAEYLARVSYRAWKGRALPTGRSWGHIRSALSTVYRELS